jgi:transcriptional regulator with PAS, ATPase and Fis domain
MEDPRILVMADGDDAAAARGEPFVAVCDRERAADYLVGRRFRAICLDRGDVGLALADARWLRQRRNRAPVIALVDPAEVGRAVELLAAGVAEIVVRDEQAKSSVLARLESLDGRRAEPVRPDALQGIVAKSPAMRACLELVRRAQRSEATVLLQGETGTGKEVLARAIHAGSRRAGGPFVAINCAAFPETLLESELFGYDRGAFTGAVRPRSGHFEQANDGTLFLDEIGETSLGFQVKLLRALQEGVVRPLGASREVKTNARIVAATNRDLLHTVETGGFRRDLYYRLNVFPISLPPLRARIEDVVPLAQRFLDARRGEEGPERIAPDAARLLETYAWPGNVRELENEMARLVANACGEPEVTARALSPQIQGLGPALPPDPGGETLRETMARLEAWVLRRALEKHGQRRIATARSLGVTRECLYKKLRRYGMQ